MSIQEGSPDWSLLGLGGIENLPAVKWKLLNVGRMSSSKKKQEAGKLKAHLKVWHFSRTPTAHTTQQDSAPDLFFSAPPPPSSFEKNFSVFQDSKSLCRTTVHISALRVVKAVRIP